MQTPSHLIITAALRRALPRVPMVKSAVLWGSIAPDVPLYLLSLGAYLYFRRGLGWSGEQTFRHMYDHLFFHDPMWISLHNVLHAPAALLVGLAVIAGVRGRSGFLRSWWTWFFLACFLHSVIDILTHHDDGPLIFYPFNWSYRFESPVSYWDARHHAAKFIRFEIALDAVLLVYLLRPWITSRLRGSRLFHHDDGPL